MMSEVSDQEIEMLDGDDAAELLTEVEEVINAIRDGEIEGEYFEF